mgnify:CR=1 FL=1
MIMNDVVQIVSTLGFPIAMCIGACFFIKYLFDTFTKQQEEMRKEHREEVSKLQTSLDNNTLALQKLIDKIGEN